MPHRLLLAFPLLMPAWSGLGLVAILAATNWDAVATVVGVLGMAFATLLFKLSPAIAQFLREVGPAWVEFRGSLRKMLAETDARAREADARARINEAELARLKSENERLQSMLGALLNKHNGMAQDMAGLGEGLLIQNGDIKDAVREKA